MLRIIALALVAAALASACASGPGEGNSGNFPQTTTTTLPPPEGVTVVRIRNASFRPSNLTIDIDELQIVRWINEDDREYTITSRARVDGERVFQSPVLGPGDEWEFDFTTVEPDVHRYFMELGAQTIPGLVDTRPAQ